MYLNATQGAQLNCWLAEGWRYGELRRRMQTEWGTAISSAAVSKRKRRHASEIAAIALANERDARRRALNAQRKAQTRALHLVAPSAPPAGHRHCATCRCTGPGAA